MDSDSSSHRGCDAQRLMDSAEALIHVVQDNRVHVVVDLFGECIGQSGKPSHLHTHREVLALNKTGGNVLRFRMALNRHRTAADASSGAVANLTLCLVGAIQLYVNRVVNIVRKRQIDRI